MDRFGERFVGSCEVNTGEIVGLSGAIDEEGVILAGINLHFGSSARFVADDFIVFGKYEFDAILIELSSKFVLDGFFVLAGELVLGAHFECLLKHRLKSIINQRIFSTMNIVIYDKFHVTRCHYVRRQL